MSFAMKIAAFAAESTAAEEAVEIVTQYSDKRVPIINFVMMGLALIVLIAVLIAGFILIRNHTRNWGTGLITGITAYLLLSVLCMVLLTVVGLIPSLRDHFNGHPTQISLLSGIVSLIIEILVLYYGGIYARYQCNKRHQTLDIGTPLAFGLGFYTVMVLLGNQISNLFSEMINAYWVNAFGFDKMIASMLESDTYTLETAIPALLEIVDAPGINYLLDALCTILVGVQVTCIEILFYGVSTAKLEKKWLLYAIVFVVLSNIQSFVAIFSSNMIILFIIGLIVTAGVVYVTCMLVQNHMDDDIRKLAYTRKMEEQAAAAEKKKMPKIVMPKD